MPPRTRPRTAPPGPSKPTGAPSRHSSSAGEAAALDRADPLRSYRRRFVVTDPDLVYFDGNSLGRLPVATRDRLRMVVGGEWATELVRGWDNWIGLAREAGDLIATGVLHARPGEVVLSDSTSVNLYKLASAALDAAGPGRGVIVTDEDNFPTDQYILEGLAAARGCELRVVSSDVDNGVSVESVAAALGPEVALVSLSHVAYRCGAVADLAGITEAAHRAGAMVLWDLSHSAGSVPVPLSACRADLAVGCTYKYLNGGPGSPAFLYVRKDLQPKLRQPIWGWFGQRDQFEMARGYNPVKTIERFQAGTPGILGVVSALEGVRLTAEAGIDAIHAKAMALTDYAVSLYESWLAPLGFRLASPGQARLRGAHVSLHHPKAWQICQALRGAGVVPDFRQPNRLRLGFAPLYTRFIDVHTGMARLRDLVAAGEHLAYPARRARVT